MGIPHFSCFPFPGRKQLASNSSVSLEVCYARPLNEGVLPFFKDPFGPTSFKAPFPPVGLVFSASGFQCEVGERTAPGGVFEVLFCR